MPPRWGTWIVVMLGIVQVVVLKLGSGEQGLRIELW
jgi:hypothetical protein